MPYSHQTGVTADANSDALFVTLNVKPDRRDLIKGALVEARQQIEAIQREYSELQPHGVIAIGSEFWGHLFTTKPKELAPFPDAGNGDSVMPSTPADLLLHLRSNRRDVTYKMACQVIAAFKESVGVVEEVAGFRYLDNRDLTGFVDGTENPEGNHRAEVAVVSDEDPEFKGGSYIHLQRYIHNFPKWKALPLKSQEDTYGRTKSANIEYPSAEKPLTAHTKRTSLKDGYGKPVEILRHSMPYGGLQEAGLLFASYCKTPRNFTLMLKSMVEGDGKGHKDNLLRYTRAVTGQAFFAPSLQWFDELV